MRSRLDDAALDWPVGIALLGIPERRRVGVDTGHEVGVDRTRTVGAAEEVVEHDSGLANEHSLARGDRSCL